MKKHILTQEEHSNNLEQALEGLRETIARCTEHGEKQATAIPGLSLFRREQATEPVSGMYEPSICMVAQRKKRVRLGEDIYTYDAHNYLITAVHLPTVVQVVKASPEKPYLGLRLTFNQHELAKLMANSLAEEQDIPILAPVIQREILYRLLVGDQGARLRQIAAAGTKSQQIARAIGWLKENFNQPLRIDDLALQAGMSRPLA